MTHKFKTCTQFYAVPLAYITYIEQRDKGRTADEVLLDFHDKPIEFNDKFMKFYGDTF